VNNNWVWPVGAQKMWKVAATTCPIKSVDNVQRMLGCGTEHYLASTFHLKLYEGQLGM
jgi:hypothetical protein